MDDDYRVLMRTLHERLFESAAQDADCEDARPFAIKANATTSDTDERATESEMSRLHRQHVAALKQRILGHIHAHDHIFFEQLIIELLLAMGYGGRRRDLARRLGKSHDGGLDGMIAMDELGLDVIYLQAKRLRPGGTVSSSQVRDFLGSLEGMRATKGVFVTTGQFSAQAQRVSELAVKKAVLVDGNGLTDLMIRHNIGVKPEESFIFKSVDLGYFRSGGKMADPAGQSNAAPVLSVRSRTAVRPDKHASLPASLT